MDKTWLYWLNKHIEAGMKLNQAFEKIKMENPESIPKEPRGRGADELFKQDSKALFEGIEKGRNPANPFSRSETYLRKPAD